MKLVSVSFENFKSFKERVELNLSRINYLIGPNGAGKSNVFAGMKMISDVLRNDAVPKPYDSFDRTAGALVSFSFTAEMSEDEKSRLFKKWRDREGVENFPTEETFRRLKYEASFVDHRRTRRTIWLSDPGGELQRVRDLRLENEQYLLDDRRVTGSNLKSMRKLPPSVQASSDMPNHDFFSVFDVHLFNPVLDLFSLELVESRRVFPGSATAGEDEGVSATGINLPNQLATMYNDPMQRQAFGDKIGALSSGEIEGVNTRLRKTNIEIALKERGRDSATTYTEISSGHHQELILMHFLHRRKTSIIMMEEPELHLHADAQKNLRKALRENLGDGQLIIATHSPIFANVSDTESTVLLYKRERGSTAILISPSNADQIRSRMGIRSEDAFDSGRLCCVEGLSEKTAMPALARKLGYQVGLSPWMLDLEGYGNTKHVELLLEYLGMYEKRFFVLLDGHSEAEKIVDHLLQKDIIKKDQCHFLEKNFEDLFPSAMLAKYSGQLAQKHNIAFGLSADDLERLRQDRSVTDVLEEEWQKQSSGRNYPKVELAGLLASIKPEEIPDEAAAAVRKVMDGLGVERGLG